jgi:ribonuclease D
LIAVDPVYQKLAQHVVQWLFESDVTVLGFSFGHDVPMLEAFVGHSLPHNFLDLQLLMTADGSSVPGLKACAARFSTMPLSKDEQCSDWARRPLSQSQMYYAGLDAAVLLVLLAEHAKERARHV